ncbi:MAG: hypothetical protein IT168_19600 [Bryobacterales bacterium]|nr:hypothetical protein [Bryobacterales bacterium]
MRTLLEQGLGLIVLGALAWYWLGVPESSAGTTVLSLVVFLALLAGILLLARRGVRQTVARWSPAWLLGIPVAWLLVKWVPGFEGFTMQAASMVVRFAIAFVLLLLAWVTALSIVGSRKAKVAIAA